MDLKSKMNGSQSFGMAFPRNVDCNRYIASAFNNKHGDMEKALKELDKRCEAHKYFDMFHSSHDDSIKIIGKSNLAGKKLSEKYKDTVLSFSKNTQHPNYAQKTKITLDELENSDIGPKNGLERVVFRIFNYFHMQYAKLHVKNNPYENLPANIRKGVDIINELEAEM